MGCQISDDLDNNKGKKVLFFTRKEDADRGKKKKVRIEPNLFFIALNTKFHAILKETVAYLLRRKNSILSQVVIYE